MTIRLNCWIFCGMIMVYIVSAEEASLLSDVWNFVSVVDFHLISSFLCQLVLFNEEIFSCFVRSYVNLWAQYFLTNKKKNTVRICSIRSLEDIEFSF